MIKCITATMLGLSIYLCTFSQTIENTINFYGDNYPAEKIHVHFDKEIYLPGETIWFKAYVFEENLPSQRSTNFYISLYDENGIVVQQRTVPIFNATADGFFEIPGNIKTSQLVCRAYTAWMLNFDTSFLFTKALKLITANVVDTAKKSLTVSLRFFPEGGDIIESERNTIAFKANYSNGLPFEIKGVIKKQETGEVITEIKSVHDGMGKFDLEQLPGEKYYAEWVDNNGKLQQTYLPLKKINGVSFKAVQQKTKLYYNIVNKLPVDTLHVLAYMYQKVIYKASLPLPVGERFTGIIPLENFPSGAMQLTVFNTNWQPVAERICFINNNNYALQSNITIKQTGIQKRAKNIIEIAVQDTLPANMSLSVTDADFNSTDGGNNIFTNLLVNGDIRGYIHNPARYFSGNADVAVKEQLDLVMLTHGWRRYNWDNMLAAKMPIINFAPDNYLGAYGQMSGDVLNKINKEEQVNLIVKTKDSTINYYSVKPDNKGILKATGIVFFDTAKLYYSFNSEKQYNKSLAFSTVNFSLPQPQQINNYNAYLIKDTTGTEVAPAAAIYKYYQSNNGNVAGNLEKTLQSVVVKSGGWRNWKNDPIIKLDSRYASGMFTGGANNFGLDVMHDEKAWTKIDFYGYIRNNIPGLTIGTFNLVTGRSISYRGNTVIVYIDEHEMTNSDLDNLSISQVAYIKFIPNFVGRGADAGGSSVTPALAVYTRKGNDLIDRTPKETDLGMVKIDGYSPQKEFYSPDYDQKDLKNALGNDSRTTLLWLPYIFTDKNNLKIPVTFYNNDFSKKIKIILEGINEEGKLIHIEKIIE